MVRRSAPVGRAVVTAERVWEALAEIPDPEIPVISLDTSAWSSRSRSTRRAFGSSSRPPSWAARRSTRCGGRWRRRWSRSAASRRSTSCWTTPGRPTGSRPKGARSCARRASRPAAARQVAGGPRQLQRAVHRCPYCGSTETRLDNIFGPTPCRSVRYPSYAAAVSSSSRRSERRHVGERELVVRGLLHLVRRTIDVIRSRSGRRASACFSATSRLAQNVITWVTPVSWLESISSPSSLDLAQPRRHRLSRDAGEPDHVLVPPTRGRHPYVHAVSLVSAVERQDRTGCGSAATTTTAFPDGGPRLRSDLVTNRTREAHRELRGSSSLSRSSSPARSSWRTR